MCRRACSRSVLTSVSWFLPVPCGMTLIRSPEMVASGARMAPIAIGPRGKSGVSDRDEAAGNPDAQQLREDAAAQRLVRQRRRRSGEVVALQVIGAGLDRDERLGGRFDALDADLAARVMQRLRKGRQHGADL